MEQLLSAEATGKRIKYLPFWGHTAPSNGAIGPHMFSQWYAHAFEHDGVRYRTAEHFMMAGKARLFEDLEALNRILNAKTPGEAKGIGREVRGFSPEMWEAECLSIVTNGSIAKFSSSAELRAYLLGSKDRVLVEASPRDRIWGIGMGRNNPLVERPSQWRGRSTVIASSSPALAPRKSRRS